LSRQGWTRFFSPFDVAQFKTKDEEVFGFENLPDSFIWMGYDIGPNWKIDRTFLYTLIDGGFVKISRKFKTNISYYVEQYGMIAMNEYLYFPDPGGSLSRRTLIHQWNYPPPSGGDPGLLQEIENNIDAVMIKAIFSLHYLETHDLKTKGICQETLPPAMWENVQEMKRTIQPLWAFLQDKGRVDLTYAHYYTSLNQLDDAFSEWKREKQIRRGGRLNPSSAKYIFNQLNIGIVSESRTDCKTGKKVVDIWVTGICLTSEVPKLESHLIRENGEFAKIVEIRKAKESKEEDEKKQAGGGRAMVAVPISAAAVVGSNNSAASSPAAAAASSSSESVASSSSSAAAAAAVAS